MDRSDDPDITAYHLKFRARSSENVNVDEESEENDGKKKHWWRNFFIRLVVACCFFGLAIGVLIWSFSRKQLEVIPLVKPTFPPPMYLNLSRSEASYSGGTVNITISDTSARVQSTSNVVSSTWLHNHGKQQLKISLGNRSEPGKWILDMYYLQYGTYFMMPNVAMDGITCYVDWNLTYSQVITQFSTTKLDNSSSSKYDVYRGQLETNNPDDQTTVWTNDKEMPYGMTVASSFAEYHYWYGENMKDKTPDFDADVSSVVRNKCQEGIMATVLKTRVTQFFGIG